jgi:hypothetical protein
MKLGARKSGRWIEIRRPVWHKYFLMTLLLVVCIGAVASIVIYLNSSQ